MTAEVALLNRTAVALAADSAMTLASGKVYPGQKLFALTKYQPVGVMVYNNAHFMGTPWETLVKMYRQRIGKESRPTIEDYLKDFLKFLGQAPFVKPAHELANIIQMCGSLCHDIRRIAKLDSPEVICTSNRARNQVLDSLLSDLLPPLTRSDTSPSIEGVNVSRIVTSCRQQLDECIEGVFHDLKLTSAVKRAVRTLLAEMIRTCTWSGYQSGVVLAGFGDEEVFPTLFEVSTLGAIEGKVVYSRRRHTDIARNGALGMIIPFAQQEMVHRFMEGMDPSLVNYLSKSMEEVTFQFAVELLDSMNVGHSGKQRRAFRDAAREQTKKYLEEMKKFRYDRFVNPIMEVVAHLPKEELAEMAEALVSLTALKRRVSPELETVGGPIDVAVISKGDGLIWIRRKHYFDAALNQSHVAKNYH